MNPDNATIPHGLHLTVLRSIKAHLEAGRYEDALHDVQGAINVPPKARYSQDPSWSGSPMIPTTEEQERLQIARALETCNPTNPLVTFEWKIRDKHALYLRTRGYIVETIEAEYHMRNGKLDWYRKEQTRVRLVPDRLLELARKNKKEKEENE